MDNGDLGLSPDEEESPFMHTKFVLSEAANEPTSETRQACALPPHRHCSCHGSDQSQHNITCKRTSRQGSPFRRKPPIVDQQRGNIACNSTAGMARTLLSDSDELPAMDPGRSFLGEPARLSAQPTVEEIQMCFAQIDLALLVETKIKPAVRRPRKLSIPCSNYQTGSPLHRFSASPNANEQGGSPEYAHRICARRAFGTPPRLVIPKRHNRFISESDTSSIDIQPVVIKEAHKKAPDSHDDQLAGSMNDFLINEAAKGSGSSRVQQAKGHKNAALDSQNQFASMKNGFLSDLHGKSAAPVAAMAASVDDLRVVNGGSSRASSPAAAGLPLPLSPSIAMQQQLVQRANIRRSLQASIGAEDDRPLHDDAGTERSCVEKWLDGAACKGARRSTTDQYQGTFTNRREDFLQKLKQIQEMAAASGGRGAAAGISTERENSTMEREKRREYEHPIWTHRSGSSSTS